MKDFTPYKKPMRDFGPRKPAREFTPHSDAPKPVVMHKSTCSQCSAPCEVPFQPNGIKPVFCPDCFKKNRYKIPVGPAFERAQGLQAPTMGEFKVEFEQLNEKMDDILEAISALQALAAVAKPAPKAKVTKAKFQFKGPEEE